MVKFLLESATEILKSECRFLTKTKQYVHSDFCVLLDNCAINRLISEHAHASLGNLYKIYSKTFSQLAFLPDFRISQLVKSNSWKYQSEKIKSGEITREDGMESIKIMYDFCKEKQTEYGDFRYEPFLSQFYEEFIKIPLKTLTAY